MKIENHRVFSNTVWGILISFVILLLSVVNSHAGSVALQWDSVQGASGYYLNYGVSSGQYSAQMTVTSASCVVPGLSEGTTYYFSAQAYNDTQVSDYSSEITYTVPLPTDETAPAITIQSPTSSSSYSTGSSTMSLAGTASDNIGVSQVIWSNSRGGSGAAQGTTNWSIASVQLSEGTNVITVTASDTAGNQKSDTLTVTYTAPDQTAPAVTIQSPTSSSSYSTGSSTMSLGGTASDNIGVSQVTWSNSRGGSGAAQGTTSWSIASVQLSEGTNVITVTASDAAGNHKSDTLTVTYTAPDQTAPTVTIQSPTSSSSYSTDSSTISLAGSASDNVGVSQVTWSNSAGGSGSAQGTASWSIASVQLSEGTNTITVTASDAAGNRRSDTITVTYDPADDTPPTVTIQYPTSESAYTAENSSISLSGVASDNKAVTQVTWSNSAGGSGAAQGTTSWSIASVQLSEGTNAITVTASDAAGNRKSDTITVTYDPADDSPPTVTIQYPTSESAYTTENSSISLSGVASDNKAVTQVSWSNSAGGDGSAQGTANWSVSSVELTEGENVITVTASDEAGNKTSASLTVTYETEQTDAEGAEYLAYEMGPFGYGVPDAQIDGLYQYEIVFAGAAGPLALHFEAYDMDSEDELQISINGQVVGFAAMTENNQWGSMAVVLLPDELVDDYNQNTIKFSNAKNWKWGIRNIVVDSLFELPTQQVYGLQCEADMQRSWMVSFGCEGADADLKLNLSAFDINHDDEVTILLNGQFIDFVATTNTGNWGAAETITLPQSELKKDALNIITFVNGYHASTSEPWGLKNLALEESAQLTPPSTPVLTGPSGTVASTTPTYTWQASESATRYYLWVDGPGGAAVRSWIEAADCVSQGMASVTPDVTLKQGDHRVWVRAWNDAGYSSWSSPLSFKVQTVSPKPGKVTLTYPSGDSVESNPVFTWTKDEQATWYYLWVNDSSGAVLKKWYTAQEVDADSACSITSGLNLKAGAQHEWWVQTWNSNGYGPWSSSLRFTVKASNTAPSITVLVGPSSASANKPIEFQWRPVESATWYYLWITTQSGEKITTWYRASDVTNGSLCSVTLKAGLNAGSHRWWAQAWNPHGYGPWSAAMTLTVR